MPSSRTPAFVPLRWPFCFARVLKTGKACILSEMSDETGSGSRPKSFAYFAPKRAFVAVGMFLYCLLLFLAFDFAYSTLTRGEEKERNPRIADAVYDHGF